MKTINVIRSLIICISLVCSVPVGAQQSHWAAPDDPVAKELIAMETMWLDLSCSPQPGIEKMFAEDFQGTATDGSRYGKEEAMQMDPENFDRQCKLGDVRIRFFGDAMALAYGSETSLHKGADGKEVMHCLAWTDTWLKRNGKWQLVAAQDNVVKCPE